MVGGRKQIEENGKKGRYKESNRIESKEERDAEGGRGAIGFGGRRGSRVRGRERRAKGGAGRERRI
jgi:hypothetical protein